MKLHYLGAVALLALSSGCASIVSESSYPVSIDSTPSATRFEVLNRAGERVLAGVTPKVVTLRAGAAYFKGEKYTVRFTPQEGAPVELLLESTLDGWYWGNILVGGLIGMLIVDPATGSMYALPDSLHASLDGQAAQQPQTGSPRQLRVTTLDRIPEARRGQLVALATPQAR